MTDVNWKSLKVEETWVSKSTQEGSLCREPCYQQQTPHWTVNEKKKKKTLRLSQGHEIRAYLHREKHYCTLLDI